MQNKFSAMRMVKFSEQTFFDALSILMPKSQSGSFFGCLIVILNVLPTIFYLILQSDNVLNGFLSDGQLKIFNFVFARYLIGDPNLLKISIFLGANILLLFIFIGLYLLLIFKPFQNTIGNKFRIFYIFSNYVFVTPITSYLVYYLIQGRVTLLLPEIILKILSALLIILNLLYVYFVTILLNDYRLHPKCSLARPYSGYLLYEKAIIYTLIFIDALIPSRMLSSVASHTIFILSIGLSSTAFLLPYHNNRVNLFNYCGSFYLIWTSLIIILRINVKSDIIKENLVVALLVGYVFSIAVIIRYRNWYKNYLIEKENLYIDNPMSYHLKFRFLLELLDNSKYDKTDEIRINSLLQLHKDECINTNCRCKLMEVELFSTGIHSETYEEKDPKYFLFVRTVILSFLEEGIAKFDSPIMLNIDKVLVYNELLGNIFVAHYLVALVIENNEEDLNQYYSFVLHDEKLVIKNNVNHLNKKNIKKTTNISIIKEYDDYMENTK